MKRYVAFAFFVELLRWFLFFLLVLLCLCGLLVLFSVVTYYCGWIWSPVNVFLFGFHLMECTDGRLIDVFRFPEQVKEKLNQSERYRQIYWNYRWCLWQVHVQRCEMWNQPLSSYRPQGSEWYRVKGHYPEASGESDVEQSDNAPPRSGCGAPGWPVFGSIKQRNLYER